MSRISAMTIGLVLIMLGAQLFLVKSYFLSPKTARFMSEHFGESASYDATTSDGGQSMFPGQSWPFYQAQGSADAAPTRLASSMSSPLGTFGQKRMAPPKWLCWPIFFLGAVFFLHGVALRGDG